MNLVKRLVSLFCFTVVIGWCSTASAAKVNFCGSSAVEDIVLTNSLTGQVAVWCDGQATSSTILGTINMAGGWGFFGVLKSASGLSDIVLYNYGSHQVATWPAGNPTAGAITGTVNVAAGWVLKNSFSDWNGDGKDDCWLWNGNTRQVAIWPSCNAAGSVVAGTATTGWTPVLFADVTGDSQADVVFQRDSDRALGVWPSANPAVSVIVGTPPSPDWVISASGKLFSASGVAMDLLWYNVYTYEMGTSFGMSLSNFSATGVLGWPEYPFMLGDISGGGVASLILSHPAASPSTPIINSWPAALRSGATTLAPYNAPSWHPVKPAYMIP